MTGNPTTYEFSRPECTLLLFCARTQVTPRSVSRIQSILESDLDWAYLLRLAAHHRVVPLLYSNLSTLCAEQVPPETLRQLKRGFEANTRRNLALTRELLNLLRLFEAHGIAAISLRGPLLATSLYGNLGLRQMYDLDILVRRRDFARARNLLESEGYRPDFEPPSSREAAFLSAVRQYAVRKDKSIVVELHWHVTPRYFSFTLDPERFWDQCVSAPLGGYNVLTLSPEDLLLILCVHGTKHYWLRLHWLCCVAELLRVHPEMNLTEVLERARRLGTERICRLAFFLVADLFGTVLPRAVLQAVQADSSVRDLALQVSRRLFQEEKDPPWTLETVRFHLQARERYRDRIRYCLHRLLVPGLKDWNFLLLPSWVSFLYYLIRPVRLFIIHSPTLLRRSND